MNGPRAERCRIRPRRRRVRRNRTGLDPGDGGRLGVSRESGHRGLGHFFEQSEGKGIVGKDPELVHVEEGIMIRYKERRGLTRPS
ncbi:hypothetical protein Taro_024823 [Colocasia esculenta]|uniref:Uncharacterized protein n=1 Tax=Colocasia esculenta TaxID=4460 RepID=A0A843VCE8_COLES|nr:hypothetical protein [Colocasia esculenta]